MTKLMTYQNEKEKYKIYVYTFVKPSVTKSDPFTKSSQLAHQYLVL